MSQNIRTFIPTKKQIIFLENKINSIFKHTIMYRISFIDEFYWDNEPKWFIHMRPDNNIKNYKEFILKNPQEVNSNKIDYSVIEISDHGSPCIATELFKNKS